MIFGNQRQGMTLTYPEKSIQNVLSPTPWWIKDTSNELHRGRLLWAFIPFIDQIPYTITPKGRTQADIHDRAEMIIEPLKIKQTRTQANLPVAGMPIYQGEVRIILRAKKRPVLILSEGGDPIPKSLTVGRPKSQTTPTILIAPFVGVDQDGTRAGYPPDFVEHVRCCEYPQFIYEKLPISSVNESFLRLDQIQSIGKDLDSFELTAYCLSNDAMDIIDEWIIWIFTGMLPTDGIINDVRKSFIEI
jgi:hypothetical protein